MNIFLAAERSKVRRSAYPIVVIAMKTILALNLNKIDGRFHTTETKVKTSSYG